MKNTKLAVGISFCSLTLLLFTGCNGLRKTVNITTKPPGATIYVNGVEGGITPITGELSFSCEKSKYDVLAKLKGYDPGLTTIEYAPPCKRDYHIDLVPNEKVVTITSHPTGAKIYINGVETGITPLTQRLSFSCKKSKYEFTAKKCFHEDGKIEITLEPLDQTHYHITLPISETVCTELSSFEPKCTKHGTKPVMVCKPTLAYLEVIERSPNAKSITRVTNSEDPSGEIGPPVLSPTDDLLVYSVSVKEKCGSSYSNIWKTKIGSFARTRVTYGKWSDRSPCFGPDGQFIVFSSNRTGPQTTLWRIRVDGGGGLTNITNKLSGDYSPSVSPDGSFIAYTSLPPEAEEFQVWRTGINGDLPTQLREGQDPQIGVQAEKILFVRKDKIIGRKQIWLMNTDGGQETQLTQNVEYDAIQPKWSPDGNWIVFASNEGFDSKKRRNYDIWIMAADGSKKTQLTTNGSEDNSPCWDRSGEFIYFRSNRGGVWNIWRLEPILPQ